jgi:PAS domain S-box-containing protein
LRYIICFSFCIVLAGLFLFPPSQALGAKTPPSPQSYYSPSGTHEHNSRVSFSKAEKKYLNNKKQITVCIDPDWMPLEKIEDGAHIGMTADYFALFQQKIPIPLTLVPTKNWSESVKYAKARKCDVFSLAMPTPDRRTYMDFTKPYLSIPLVLAGRRDMPFVDDITALNNIKFGVVKGYAFGEILRRRYPKMDIADVPSVDVGLKMVAEKKLDGFIGTLATVVYSIRKNFALELKVAGKFDERWELGVATRNDEPLLRSIFEKAIASVSRSEQERILNRWIAVKYVKEKDYTVLWRVLMGAAVVSLFLLWRLYTMRKFSAELKKQYRHVKVAEERYRQIFNTPNEAIFLHDANTAEILDVNQGMLKMFGCTYEEALQAGVDNISSGKFPFTAEKALSKVRNTALHGPQKFDWLARKKDNTLFWIDVSLKYTEFGGQHYVIAVVRDIDARKKAEEALYFTQSAIDHSDDSAFWSGQDGRLVYVNEAACRSLGYSRDELMALTISDFDPNSPVQAWDEHWQELKEKGFLYLETTHRTKDGKEFPVEVRATFLVYEGKEFNCSFARDITERKQAETNIAAEKERLIVTLRSIGDGVITTDTVGNIVLMNKISEKLTGWSNSDAAGKPLGEVFHIINEQTREVCKDPVTKVINSGQIIELANHTILIAKDGTERSIADSGAPIMDSESKIVGVVLVFRDVSEQIKTERELLKVKKLESIGVLAGGIAHDFNNILAAILGNINLALFDDELPDATKKLLLEAEKASLRAKDLTQQLLTFSKGGAPVKETASLDSVIRDSANFVLHGSQVTCRFNIPDDLMLVEIDKGQISQVIQNIALNAGQAMPTGGIVEIFCKNISSEKLPATLSASKQMFVEILIKDEGIGMAANLVDKIFDPYFSTKQEGSGLGLAITHAIITKHGGHIFAESLPGQGTSFTIYLPATENGQLENSKASEFKQQCSQAKILIMDDEAMVRKVSQAMLTKLGHQVELSKDGEEAIELYKKAVTKKMPFDLVIVDLTIPNGMGGNEAAQKILEINSEAKIIVSSGYSNDPIMSNFGDFGFCGAIVKPYQLQELSKVVAQAA